ncbi:histone H2A [Alligator mississippiensis]|uniref:Histone H2A n=1 Tax=Alligator mississippiensis TaxID=8496 RepID=A0A151NVT0_ALLMI|nr:histone H2A [Alligator mississippiensis]KYO40898.1 histone H2A-like [Alligator mississippiensis]
MGEARPGPVQPASLLDAARDTALLQGFALMSRQDTASETSQAQATSRASPQKLHFPVDQLERMLRQRLRIKRIKGEALVYLAAVTQYLTAQILAWAGKATRGSQDRVIAPRHLQLAALQSKDFRKLLLGSKTVFPGGVLPGTRALLLHARTQPCCRSRAPSPPPGQDRGAVPRRRHSSHFGCVSSQPSTGY